MNSISFHNAIVSLLKGVLDEEHEEVKLVPDESVKGGAPAIEAIDDMFKGGADGFVNSEETKANDRYVDEGDDAIEIDNPDDLINGGAFDDGEESSSTSEEEKEEPAKEKGSSADEKEPAKETPEEENANTENKEPAKETSENKENPAEEPEHEAVIAITKSDCVLLSDASARHLIILLSFSFIYRLELLYVIGGHEALSESYHRLMIGVHIVLMLREFISYIYENKIRFR